MSSTFVIGLLLVILAGALEGVFSLGVTRTPKWPWEVSWGLGSLIALVVVPWPLALATIPHLLPIYRSVPPSIRWTTFLLGVGWGLGGIFYGKAVAAVGMALGVSLLMALVSVFGSIAPFLVYQREKLLTPGGFVLMGAIAVMVVGISFVAKAGTAKQADLATAPITGATVVTRTPFMIGLLFCLLSGVLSGFVNFAFIAGADLAAAAEKAGAPVWAKGFAIWALAFTSHFIVNFLYAFVLMIKNQTWRLIGQGGLGHLGWVTFMGIAWPAGIAVYGIAAFLMGEFGAFVAFPMMLVCSILFGNLAGAANGEWRGASGRAMRWMAIGVAVLFVALATMGWSNFLLAQR